MTERRALTRNASDAQQVKRAGKAERLARQQADDRLNDVLGMYTGRAVLWDVLESAGVFRQTHAGEATHETAFRNGERNVGLRLMAEVTRVNLKAYHDMQREAQEREQQVPEPPAKTDEPFEESDGN